jgi:TonB-dependent starch-binding outer membrane protein SusC
VSIQRETGSVSEGATVYSGDARPLYILDGVIVSGAIDLAAMSIETIEVVKGPAAARLYGSRAAHGVILIRARR